MLTASKRAAAGTRLPLLRRYLASDASNYPLGKNIHGFSIQQTQPVPEYSLTAVRLLHEATGLEHLHLDSADRNNVFLIAFKTNPPDATGVPHILEHTTLCGLYKYPVRDPFFKMLNRSLSNFMNAMTGHDYTYYPFATTNSRDFKNLLDVYLSSVFEPLLTYEDFLQEGWRLEQSDLSDKLSDIAFKGVVYNEMKGQYANSAYYYWIKFQEAIYPSLKNSGGDPSKITTLHYEDLVDFHNLNYHPLNARTFSYGSMPLEGHLEKLNETYKLFGKRQRLTGVRKPVFALSGNSPEAYNVAVPGPVDPMSSKPVSEQYKTSVTWSLGDALDPANQYNVFKWKILSLLLFDGHNAPFYQELIEKQYGEDFSVNAGLDATTALLSFTVGLNNVSKEMVEGLEKKVIEILEETVLPELAKPKGENTFSDRIEAILHQIELNFKKHKPEFGLGLLNSVVSTWVNDADPIKALQVEKILNKFKADYESNGLNLFSELINEGILNTNAKKFTFTMTPDENFNKALSEEEANRLKTMTEKLTEEDKDVIFERSQKLLEKQQTQEDASVLPTLTIDDIPRNGEFYPLQHSTFGVEKKLQKRLVDTNGLVYVSAIKDLSYFPSKYYKYLPLFNQCLTNLAGTENTSITDLETKIQKYTGGVSFGVSAKTDPFNVRSTKLKYALSGMSLRENASHIYELWHEILQDTKFEAEELVVDKLATLVKNLGQNQVNVIADRGHSYANAHSNSQLTPTKYINDVLGGLEHVKFVLELNSELSVKGKEYLTNEVLPILREIKDLILSGTEKGFSYSLLGDKDTVAENERLVEQFDSRIESLVKKETHNELGSLISGFQSSKGSKSVIDLPFQVGYASLAKLGAGYTNPDGAALQVLSQLLTFKHLHSVIREANGAYGGGLNYDGLGGVLNFYSYRDPNPLKSVSAFRASPQVAVQKLLDGWDSKDLQEAKLAIFQSIDAPSHVASQGSSTFMEGITDDMKQERRERFLDVRISDLQRAAEKYLLPSEGEVVTVIGDAKALGVKEDEWTVKTLKSVTEE